MKNKKLVLGIIAMTMVVALTVGGTLMLLKDNSGVATNIIDFSGLTIALCDEDVARSTSYFEGNGTIEWQEWNQEDEVQKHTWIEHRSGVDAYLCVDVQITITDASGLRYDDVFDVVMAQLTAEFEWVGDSAPTNTGGVYVWEGVLYYGGVADLDTFSLNDTATLINGLDFTGFTSDLSGVNLKLEFNARAVQILGNAYLDTGDVDDADFPAFGGF